MLVFKTVTWSYKSILAIKNFTGSLFHVKVSTNIRKSGKRTLKFSNFCICLLFTKGAMRQEDMNFVDFVLGFLYFVVKNESG